MMQQIECNYFCFAEQMKPFDFLRRDGHADSESLNEVVGWNDKLAAESDK